MQTPDLNKYSYLVDRISETFIQGRNKATIAVNQHLVETYWKIGEYIVEFEQEGKERAEYGKSLIDNLATDLSIKLGKGFSRSNLIYMRLFYLEFPLISCLSVLFYCLIDNRLAQIKSIVRLNFVILF